MVEPACIMIIDSQSVCAYIFLRRRRRLSDILFSITSMEMWARITASGFSVRESVSRALTELRGQI